MLFVMELGKDNSRWLRTPIAIAAAGAVLLTAINVSVELAQGDNPCQTEANVASWLVAPLCTLGEAAISGELFDPNSFTEPVPPL